MPRVLTWESGKPVLREPTPEELGPVVSKFQAKAALYQAGLLDAVEDLISQSDALTQLAWVETVEFRRSSPTINSLAEALGLTPTQVDELFASAAQIRA